MNSSQNRAESGGILPLSCEEPVKILIIKPSALGDIVHSLPFLYSIKKHFPQAVVHWVVAKGLHTFLEGHPLIDKLWVMDKNAWKRLSNLPTSLKEIRQLWSGLKRESFDVSVDLSGLLRSGLITWGAGARYRLGFKESDEGSPLFYSHKIEGGKEIHAIDRYLRIAAFMGCPVDEIRYPFAPYDDNPPLMAELPRDYAVLAPSAGKEANRWPAEKFGRLAASLPVPTVVISSAAEEPVVRRVVDLSAGKAVSLAGRTSLKELIPVIRKARFFVTNDTGPMHIAAALDVPVFAIFGPANPVRTGPYGEMHTVIRQEIDCAPCYRWKPCSHWRCMEDLSVEKVLDVITEKMAGIDAGEWQVEK